MKEVKIITNVRQSYFSIARFYGGCTIEGKTFKYFQDDDVLIRSDVVAKYKKSLKQGLSLDEFAKLV